MSYQVLARKYRPQRFSEVIGQDHVTRTLKNAIAQQRIAHGYIFSGHRGIGKTTIARILAMALNCRATGQPAPEPCGECDSCKEVRAGNAVDVIEIDAATNRGIDEIRELRDAARYRPARDRYKIYILDEAHQITDAAFNALLKTLEEPPPHIVFMMATTQPEDIPQTIRSRCQHFSFHAVRFEEIVSQLRAIAAHEGIHAEEDALAVLAEAGDGSLRDALSIMDQAIACCGASLGADVVHELIGSVGSEVLEDLMGAVARGSSEEALRLLDKLLATGQNPAHFAKQLVRFLRNATVAGIGGPGSPLLQVSSGERERVGRVAAQFSEEDLARFMQIMLRTYDDLGYRQEQRFHLELGVLKLVHAQRLLPLEQILSQIVPAGPGALRGTGEAAAPRASRPVSNPAAMPAASGSRPPAPTSSLGASSGGLDVSGNQEKRISPFEADRTRKTRASGPEMSADGTAHEASKRQPSSATVITATVEEPEAATVAGVTESTGTSDPSRILGQVLVDLEKNGDKMLASELETGSAILQGDKLVVTLSRPVKVIELMMQADQKRIANAAASRIAGCAMKVEVVSGGPAHGNGAAAARPARDNASAPSRAANEAVVRRMQEKFGAEIRTVIDHREKN